MDNMLSIRQAADILNVHWKTVYNFIHAKPQIIKAQKVGRQWRIKKQDLDDYLNGEK